MCKPTVDTIEYIVERFNASLKDEANFKKIIVENKILKELLKELKNACFDILLSITGVDEPDKQRLRVVYHITSSTNPSLIVAVETYVTYANPYIDSVIDLWPSAQLQEREVHEMLGIVFKGNPDLRHLLLPDDWPSSIYPLRKSFKVVEEPLYLQDKSTKSIRSSQ